MRGELDLGQLLRKRATVHGSTLRSRPLAEKAEIVSSGRAGCGRSSDPGRSGR